MPGKVPKRSRIAIEEKQEKVVEPVNVLGFRDPVLVDIVPCECRTIDRVSPESPDLIHCDDMCARNEL